MIFEELNKILKQAVINKDEDTKNYIRGIKSKTTEYCVSNQIDRDKTPTDELMINIISSHKKSLEKAIVQFKKGGDVPLIAEYEKEIEFFVKFLPSKEQQIAEIEKIVDEAISIIGNNIGKVMGHVMKNYHYDGGLVRSIVMRKL